MEIPKRDKHLVLLLFIVILALFLRFYGITQNPPGYDWDEASSVYNGYSIAKTGKDEYGKSFPILFRAYDAYVPPVLIYLDALSSSLFGLNGFAARFPNALLGTASIFGIYLLTDTLTKNKKLALFSAFFLALSPWHVTYSRVGTFAPLPIIFIIFGTYFFIRGLTQKLFLFMATLCFIIATLSYFSAYIFVPLFVLVLILLYRKYLSITLVIIIYILIISAAVIPFVYPGGQTRFRGVSALSDPDIIKKDAIYALQEWGGKLLHNRRLVYAQILLDGYFSNFQFAFLFNKADAVTRFVVPGSGFGLLYWWEFPILLFGTYQLLKHKPNGWLFIFIWLLLAPLPTAPALPKPASTRAILMVPAFSMLGAYGFWYLISKCSRLIRYIFVVIFAINTMLFIHQYFVHFPQEKEAEWFAAYKPLFTYLNRAENRAKNILFLIQRPDYLDEVHMFTAFYNQIDPQFYQNTGGTRMGNFGTTGEFSIGRFKFIPKECTKCDKFETYGKEDLLVTAYELPFKPVMIFPTVSRPALFLYKAGDVSLK